MSSSSYRPPPSAPAGSMILPARELDLIPASEAIDPKGLLIILARFSSLTAWSIEIPLKPEASMGLVSEKPPALRYPATPPTIAPGQLANAIPLEAPLIAVANLPLGLAKVS